MVVVPLVLLAWVAWRLAQEEQAVLREQMRNLLADRLRDIDRVMGTHFENVRRDMHRLTSVDRYSPDALRKRTRQDARVLQLFVIQPNGALLYPNPLDPLNRKEREFLTRASQIIIDRDLQRAADASSEQSARDQSAASPGSKKQRRDSQTATGQEASGWFVWYWGRGLNLVYWQRRRSRHIVAAALDRARWMADLIAALPDTPQSSRDGLPEESAFRIRLIDSTARTVYQWGQYRVPDQMTPASEIALSSPLAAWRLQQFVPAGRLARGTGSGTAFNLVMGLAVAAAGLVILALYFYREYARDMRESARRVTFVNQVSHELRAPLTNIQMYAELLEADLQHIPQPQSDRPRGRLKVIQSESQRLSRLIGNVLTFAREQRKALRLNPAAASVDRIVGDVIERFRPSLEKMGIRTEFDAGAERPVMVDGDALEQILGNLISNVEKYAAGGRWVGIVTRNDGGRTLITVSDRGPGINASARERVFQPFWRASDKLDQAAGTGIGLAIARQLARLHGGDITLDDCPPGAHFRVMLATPPVPEEGAA